MTETILLSGYETRLRRLYALEVRGEKYDLSGPRALHEALGCPGSRLRSVLIGGTNGKGSTATFLEACLRRAGLKTGLFTSPHLVSFRERIRINGQPISHETVVHRLDPVLEFAQTLGNSFFETTWALAADIFHQESVDIAIWEVGLGGRLDATNVLEPEVSAITSIDLDHTAILGPTLDHIAREKMGIFRTHGQNFTAATGAGLAALKQSWSGPLQFIDTDKNLPKLILSGSAQRRNASLALAMCAALGESPDGHALTEVRWPGRSEAIGNIFLDCAHNPASIGHLMDTLGSPSQMERHLIFGALRGKDVVAMSGLLVDGFESVTLVTPDSPRAIPADELRPLFNAFRRVRVVHSVARAIDHRPANGQTIICGSALLVGEARAHLMGMPFPECGIRTHCR